MRGLGGVAATSSVDPSSVTGEMNASSAAGCRPADPPSPVVFLLVYSLLFLVGLLLNGFTLRVYFCRRQQTSSSVTVYLKNLAASDFLLSLCLPLRISNYASSSVPVHQVYCTFGSSAFYLNMYASILFMGYIAANRYLKIVHPLGTHFLQTVRAAHIISTATWVFLLSVSSTYILLSLFPRTPAPSAPFAVSCRGLHSLSLSLFHKIIHTGSVALFLLVLVSLVLFYHGTSRRLWQAQQRQPASSSSKRLAKSRRNMSVLVGVFCVCFVPYHLVRLPYAFLQRPCSSSPAFFYLKELSVMLSVLNVCLDPLIYFIFCKAFRAQLSVRRRVSTTGVTSHAARHEQRDDDAGPSPIMLTHTNTDLVRD